MSREERGARSEQGFRGGWLKFSRGQFLKKKRLGRNGVEREKDEV